MSTTTTRDAPPALRCVHLHVTGFSRTDVRTVLQPWAADPRRWRAAGVDLVLIDEDHAPHDAPLTPPDGDRDVVNVRLQLASPGTLARVTRDDPSLRGLSVTSMADAPRAIYIHAGNWRHKPAGAAAYATLDDYRVALLDHELYHALAGGAHMACPAPGAWAPIGMQPSRPLQGCLPVPRAAGLRRDDPSFVPGGGGLGGAAPPLLTLQWQVPRNEDSPVDAANAADARIAAGGKKRRRGSRASASSAPRRQRSRRAPEEVHDAVDAREPQQRRLPDVWLHGGGSGAGGRGADDDDVEPAVVVDSPATTNAPTRARSSANSTAATSFPSWPLLVATRVRAAIARSASPARACARSSPDSDATDDATHVALFRTLALQQLEAQHYRCEVCGCELTRRRRDPHAASLDRLHATPCTYLGAAATTGRLADVNFRWLCVADNAAGRACFMPHARYAPGIPCVL